MASTPYVSSTALYNSENPGTGLGGALIGDSTAALVGFYGKTPIAQQSVTHVGTTTISQVATSGKWAFSSSTAAKALVSLVQSLQTKLDTLGIVAKS